MSSIGSGYDDSCFTYSPDGKVFQVEYASKAVENSSTSISIKCKDGVIFGVEKLLISKMLEKSSNKRIFSIGTKIGMAISGFLPDVQFLVSLANDEVKRFKNNFGTDILVQSLAKIIAMNINMYTHYHYYRPFGCAILIGGYDEHNEWSLYGIDCYGNCYGYFANGNDLNLNK